MRAGGVNMDCCFGIILIGGGMFFVVFILQGLLSPGAWKKAQRSLNQGIAGKYYHTRRHR